MYNYQMTRTFLCKTETPMATNKNPLNYLIIKDEESYKFKSIQTFC